MASETGAADFGRYRMGRLLGRGGMGEVYLAHDVELGRDVAIKFVSADHTGDDTAARRLLHEAHAAAMLDHPSICAVYETGRAPDGRAFIVMQYVEGQSLSAILDNGPLPPREALTLSASIAEALSVAHRRGLVHRDLKPSNVMVMPSGRPKLLDFGIAKQVVMPGAASDVSTSSSGVTTAGTIIGTPAYMSPEQIQQRPLDGRSDLFSLGALLFECLTGKRAFQGPSTLETIANVLHVDPPAPSSLRADLNERHDELCGKLLAKEATDRFQSADELVGAIRMMTETSRTTLGGGLPKPSEPRPLVSRRVVIVATALLVLTAVGAMIWKRPAPLPPVPPEADEWYQRGLQAMRDGSYETARRRFEQAVSLFPEHVLAYTRLAEAYAELDDGDSAQRTLLRLPDLVPDESRLPKIEQLKVQALRASVRRQVDQAIELHRQLVHFDNSSDEWLDLGRAQESAGLRKDARDSYARAVELGPQSATAHLRLASAEAQAARMPEAMRAFAEAERLYRENVNIEGETEVLLQREVALENAGEIKSARADLDRAVALATNSGSTYQQVRARLALSRITAIQGQFAEAERVASTAVQEATDARLDTVAADGLVDLAFTLQQLATTTRNASEALERAREAERLVRRALQLAEDRGALRIAARARLQLGSLQLVLAKPAEALTLTGSALPLVRKNSYRLLELDGLQIAVRAHQSLDQLDTAREEANAVLALATTVKDEISIATASTNLASVLTALGQYPEALRLRLQAEAIHRRMDDTLALPFDLTNRADLLFRLGRSEEAEAALVEFDHGVDKGLATYRGLAERATFLRAQGAAYALECGRARGFLQRVSWDPSVGDSANVIGPAVDSWCAARLGGRRNKAASYGPLATGIERDLAYWQAMTALERGEHSDAIDHVEKGLAAIGRLPFDELRWRLAAVGAAAAADETRRGEFVGVANTALSRLRTGWKADFAEYGKRADVVYLVRRARLS